MSGDAMRLYSTTKSALEVEFSVVAFVETFVMVAISLWLAAYVLQDWSYVALGATLAPLTLLRTAASERRALDWMISGSNWIDNCQARAAGRLESWLDPNWPRLEEFASLLFSFILIGSFYCISSPCIRITATAVSIFTEPLSCFRAVPRNFARTCFAKDFFHPPELVPGIETSEELRELRFSGFLRGFQDLLNERNSYPGYIFLTEATCALILFLTQLLAYTYRLSVKATAVVWLPLLWIIVKTSSDDGLLLRLKLLARSSWGRFIPWLSATVLVALAVKLVVYHGITSLPGIVQRWEDVPLVRGPAIIAAKEFHDLVVPFTLPPWQLAGACNALLALFLYFYASHQLLRLEDGGDPHRTDWVIRTGTAARVAMSLYTISCLLYNVALLAGNWDWPPLGNKFVPWQ